jgi:riboflavin kinase/FMN adenylyltransferase
LEVHFGLRTTIPQPSWLTIGSFDGVHRGHQRVIRRVIQLARKRRGAATVLTFDPHPRCILQPDNCPPSLTTVDEKAEILSELGVERMVVVPFDRKIAALSATAFMDQLRRQMALQGIVAGYDFAFGHNRRGDRAFLERYGDRHGFPVEVVAPHSAEGQVVSSSRIRGLLLEGLVGHAARLLGREYSISSFVESGSGTGSRIGYPTANLAVTPNKLVPRRGVYAVRVDVGGSEFQGAMNIGYRPTFGENRLTVEVFIFDFSGDIYRTNVKALLVQRIRDEKKFESVDALVAQIGRDVERARSILASRRPRSKR